MAALALAGVFLALWLGHYLYRAFVFPFLGSGGKAPMPVSVVLSAFVFNVANGTIQGWGLFRVGPPRDPAWLLDARFLVGLGLFAAGFGLHVAADAVLRRLREHPVERDQRHALLRVAAPHVGVGAGEPDLLDAPGVGLPRQRCELGALVVERELPRSTARSPVPTSRAS